VNYMHIKLNSAKFAILFLLSFLNPSFASYELTILAPQEISYPITEIVRKYVKEYNDNIYLILENEEKNIKFLEDGEGANIIITTHPQWINALKQKGLIDVTSIKKLVTNKFILASNSLNINNYGNDFLNIISNNNIYVEKDNNLVYYQQLEQNINNINLIYTDEHYIDTLQSKTNSIVLITNSKANQDINKIMYIPQEYYDIMSYNIAIISNDNMTGTRKLFEFITNSDSYEIFKKHGLE